MIRIMNYEFYKTFILIFEWQMMKMHKNLKVAKSLLKMQYGSPSFKSCKIYLGLLSRKVLLYQFFSVPTKAHFD